MYDADGRLLYVGKAANVRARVRTHIRGSSRGGAFGDWTTQAASVEVRIAHSELEALLVEAELIRLLRPPFNRQMRLWSRYCYLCENGKAHGQLEVRGKPLRGKRCFGPFRSRALAADILDAGAAQFGLALCPLEDSSNGRARLLPAISPANLCQRYYRGTCAGPCAERVNAASYAEALRRRDALLGGIDDAALRAFEEEVERRARCGAADDATRPLRRRAHVLRAAFEHARLLREAAAILDGMILLPGPESTHLMAMLTRDGLRLELLRKSTEDAARVLQAGRAGPRGGQTNTEPIPKPVMDSLCTAVRELRRGEYLFVPLDELRGMEADQLLALAFTPRPAEQTTSALKTCS